MIGIKVEVRGERALFTRPELKVERYSYDVMTPSAARGILESIYWHPGLLWKIDKIHVLNEIRFGNIRRNEVNSKISAKAVESAIKNNSDLSLVTTQDIAQRATTYLKDVHYVIEAHFEMTKDANPSDNEGKFADITRRRIKKGQCYSQPYFGVREFPVSFKYYDENDSKPSFYDGKEKDLGIMLYDMDYSDPENIVPQFFRPIMKNGIIDVARSEVLR